MGEAREREREREDVDEGCTKTEKAPHSLTHSPVSPPFLLSPLLRPAQFTPMGPGLAAHAQMLPKVTGLDRATALGFCHFYEGAKLNSALH